ncbi:phosphosulfolactate synthase [Lacticaseibacillus sharpeae]|uniref:Phosphosulfolactate synthase n=1 Tax=Lacticaseibacillus sharpeae JCM 1186 = DSM 20505 TaxID=1291052 RepID=A0A0R1ZIF6_9LACO|nr:phosphosulfolactate synthase [Lacticaseibacillus sharpeae]KRM54768.1 phosphosulfolactate synthase [Lacticaseibacillus sharpeae JCM 1186 = DSM 20505]
MNAFNFLGAKPATGKTMMLDKGLGLHAVDDLLATAGTHISFAKFGWGTAATMDAELIKAKTAKYRAAGIIPYPGGTLLEVATAAGKLPEFFAEAKELGFTGIEVSDGSTQVGPTTRANVIQQARAAGFYVISEVGKKNPELDHDLSTAERRKMIQADLDNGAHYVILEAREAGKNIGIYDADGNIIGSELDALAAIGVDKLIIEAPLKSQQVALILKYGPNINLGNIAWDEVTALETLRRGLRGDTVGKIE